MKLIHKSLVRLCLLSAIFLSHLTYAQELPKKYRKVQRVLDKSIKNGLSGVSIYINHPKHGEWQGSSGYANMETQEPLLPRHIMSLASVGKTYAATAAVLMQEEGLLDLDQLITAYLPKEITDGIEYADQVTVRQLMNMTTGFYNYSRNAELNDLYLSGQLKLDTLSHVEALERYMFDQKPWAQPGERYNYSSTNYKLLALIMDRQLGYPHRQYYEKKIFEPLGLTNTSYRNEPKRNLAQHYGDLSNNDTLDNITSQMIETTNWFIGDDGVYSTAKEAGVFMEALNTGKIVSPASYQEMTNWIMPDDPDYGLGLMTDKQILYRQIIGHSGVAIGSTADVYYFPKQNMTMSIVSNTGKRIGAKKFKKAYNKMILKVVVKMLIF